MKTIISRASTSVPQAFLSRVVPRILFVTREGKEKIVERKFSRNFVLLLKRETTTTTTTTTATYRFSSGFVFFYAVRGLDTSKIKDHHFFKNFRSFLPSRFIRNFHSKFSYRNVIQFQ